MKTQETTEYHLYDVLGIKDTMITESIEDAARYFSDGWSITEVHTFKWKPTSSTTTTTVVTYDWNEKGEKHDNS